MSKLRTILAVLGPGILAVGYTIGTGSVTSMAVAYSGAKALTGVIHG